MNLVQIDIVHAEAAQGRIDRVQEVLAGKASTIRAIAHRVVNLGSHHDLFAAREVAQCAPEDLLAGTLRVHVCGIEIIDALLQGMLDERTTLCFRQYPVL